MQFFIGTQAELPAIWWNQEAPGFHTAEPDTQERAVGAHFSFPVVTCFGSDQRCGCGFRHALLHQGRWFEVTEEEDSTAWKNHLEMLNYMETQVPDAVFEIYGCWDGDFNAPPLVWETIDLHDLAKEDFHFKERGFYTVTRT